MKALMINYLKENVDREVFLELNLPVLVIVQAIVMEFKVETQIINKIVINIIKVHQEFIQ